MDPATSDTLFKQILVWAIPCVPAITLHECAHGWMALRFGDTTARDAGRLSLNPIRHVDPVGTLVVPGLMLLAHMPFVFGWAKPVPVNFERLKNGRLGVILVALAGPLANFFMMLGWLALALLVSGGGKMPETAPGRTMDVLAQITLAGAAINLVLMIFNLIPVPPLDGGRIVGAILPAGAARYYMRLERVGIIVVLVLVATGAFNAVLEPLLDFFFSRLGMT